ncbi:hypothetical protein PGT21_004728 [Puccinia graminis f. sp. tritici]|uniref:Uncharacterized protein n=1 Tax=Puccinia graminis f. sp. tritici TaxID=56615 RepID=A0A5B0P638_PUCGR|nr:hypothetical protein PGT21_004728 [Puccinia graminis f. sp. tritici]
MAFSRNKQDHDHGLTEAESCYVLNKAYQPDLRRLFSQDDWNTRSPGLTDEGDCPTYSARITGGQSGKFSVHSCHPAGQLDRHDVRLEEHMKNRPEFRASVELIKMIGYSSAGIGFYDCRFI